MLFILNHNESENNVVSLYFSFFCHLLIYSSKQPHTTRGQTEIQTSDDIGRNNVDKVLQVVTIDALEKNGDRKERFLIRLVFEKKN